MGPPVSASPAPGLVLATVVVTFDLGADGWSDGFPATAVRDALMDHPDVVTVRPDSGEASWLYRMDVEFERADTAREVAVTPARHLAQRFGWQANIESVVFMSEREKAVFHRRFTQARSLWAGPPPTGPQRTGEPGGTV